MKTCNKCEERKPDTEFFFRDRKTNKRHNSCKSCYSKDRAKIYSKYYDAHKHVYRRRARDAANKNKNKLLELLKSKRCLDCGETDPVVLDFDHRDPSNKTKSISRMIASFSWSSILEEIAKCDVVCANCHRRRTAKMFGSYRLSFDRVAE